MYDRSAIMKEAWSNYRLWHTAIPSYTFARALRLAWHYAKQEAAKQAEATRYEVVGMKLWNGSARVIVTGVDHETAARIQWENRCQYDNVEIRKIA